MVGDGKDGVGDGKDGGGVVTGIRLNAIVLDWGRAFQFWAPPISTVPVKTAEVIVLLERESPLRAVAWNWSNYSRFSATQTRAGRNPPLSPFCERGRLVLRAEIRFANGGDWRCGPKFELRTGEIGVAGRSSNCERGRLGLRAEIRFAKGGDWGCGPRFVLRKEECNALSQLLKDNAQGTGLTGDFAVSLPVM